MKKKAILGGNWKFGENLEIWKTRKKFRNLKFFFEIYKKMWKLEKKWKFGNDFEIIWKIEKKLAILKKIGNLEKWKFEKQIENLIKICKFGNTLEI